MLKTICRAISYIFKLMFDIIVAFGDASLEHKANNNKKRKGSGFIDDLERYIIYKSDQ